MAVQVLIDPVCMFTIYPQLLRNFVYRLPRLHWRMGLHGVIDTARYLFSRNLVIAEAFGRKFAWHKVRPAEPSYASDMHHQAAWFAACNTLQTCACQHKCGCAWPMGCACMPAHDLQVSWCCSVCTAQLKPCKYLFVTQGNTKSLHGIVMTRDRPASQRVCRKHLDDRVGRPVRAAAKLFSITFNLCSPNFCASFSFPHSSATSWPLAQRQDWQGHASAGSISAQAPFGSAMADGCCTGHAVARGHGRRHPAGAVSRR